MTSDRTSAAFDVSPQLVKFKEVMLIEFFITSHSTTMSHTHTHTHITSIHNVQTYTR